jgi:hypothetical protein
LGPWKIRLIAGLSLILLPAAVAAPGSNDVAVVVHPDVQTTDLSFAELRQLLLADRLYWNSSLRVTILIPEGRERGVVLKTVYQMTEAQFRQFWIAKIFRAEATVGPKIVYTDDMAVELVNAIPGALAVVYAAHIPGNLKVLRIDGRLPGEKGYRLH